VGELKEMCRNARRLAQLCDDLEPLVDLRLPASRFERVLLDEATDDDDEPFIWDLD